MQQQGNGFRHRIIWPAWGRPAWGLPALGLAVGCWAPAALALPGLTPPLSPEGAATTAPIAQEPLENLEDGAYWHHLCTVRTEAGQLAAAQSACAEALERDPQNLELWLTYSHISLELQDYPEVVAATQEVLARDGNHTQAWTEQCIAWFELNQLDQAWAACDQAIQSYPEGVPEAPIVPWIYQGRVLIRQGQPAAAIALYDQALQDAPNHPQLLTYQCEADLALGEYDRAVERCTAALNGSEEWGSDSPALAWYYQGLALAQSGQLAAAVEAFDQAIRIDPEDARFWFQQAQVLERLGRHEEALLSYTQAVTLEPTPPILLGQCTALNQTGQYQAALEACQRALSTNPTEIPQGLAQIWLQQAQALTGLGRYPAALAAANQAIRLHPENAAAWNSRGVVLWYLGNGEGAIAALEQATELAPDNALAWANQGRVFRTLKQFERSLAAYDKALEIDGMNPDLWANRSVAQWYLEQYEPALASADRAIELDDQSYLGWYNRATALFSLGRYADAGRAYQQAIRIHPNNADAWTGMGVVLAQLNRPDEARRVLAKALELDPYQRVAQSTLRTLPPPRPPAPRSR